MALLFILVLCIVPLILLGVDLALNMHREDESHVPYELKVHAS